MRSDAARAVHVPKHLLATLTAESWEVEAHCRGPMAWWWDDHLDGAHSETPQERRARHRRAQAVCATCPALQACAAAVTPQDSGVRAGRLLGTDQCSDCGCPMTRNHTPQQLGHRRHAAHGRCHSCFKHSRAHPEMVGA